MAAGKNKFIEFLILGVKYNDLPWVENSDGEGLYIADIVKLMESHSFEEAGIQSKNIESFRRSWRDYGFVTKGRGTKDLLMTNGCLTYDNYVEQIPLLIRKPQEKGQETCRSRKVPRNGAAGGPRFSPRAASGPAGGMDAKEFYDRLDLAENKLQAAQVRLNLILAGQIPHMPPGLGSPVQAYVPTGVSPARSQSAILREANRKLALAIPPSPVRFLSPPGIAARAGSKK